MVGHRSKDNQFSVHFSQTAIFVQHVHAINVRTRLVISIICATNVVTIVLAEYVGDLIKDQT